MSMVCVANRLLPLGVSVARDCLCWCPGQSAGRGGAPGFWQYDRRREATAGAEALVSRQWNPPPNITENNNNMTIRRIYNKAIYFFEMSVLFETGE